MKPVIERVQALANISRSHYVAPIANSPNSTQLWASLTIPPSYIRVSAIVWPCGCGQTATQTHRREWPLYISRLLRLTRNV